MPISRHGRARCIVRFGITVLSVLACAQACAALERVEALQDTDLSPQGSCLMQGNLNTLKKHFVPIYGDVTEEPKLEENASTVLENQAPKVFVSEATHQQPLFYERGLMLAATYAKHVRVAFVQRLHRLKSSRVEGMQAVLLVSVACVCLILLGFILALLLTHATDERSSRCPLWHWAKDERISRDVGINDAFSRPPFPALLPARTHVEENSVKHSPSLPKRATSFREHGNVHRHLCPELVVLADSECTLLVPLLPFQHITTPKSPMKSPDSQFADKSRASEMEFMIHDSRGIPVFRISASSAISKSASASTIDGGDDSGFAGSVKPQKQLSLSSAIGQQIIFAYLMEPALEYGESPSFLSIHYRSGEQFAILQKDAGDGQLGYRVKVDSGWQLFFMGNWKLGAMNATDHNNTLHATVEPRMLDPVPCRTVRIGPLIDVGLVVLALVGIDWLESYRNRNRMVSGGFTFIES